MLDFRHRLTTADGQRLRPLAYLFLGLLCLAFFTPGLASLPPTDRDESSFAQASKQMIETGNYADIRLQNEPRYKKPIGIYWLQSSAVRLFNPQHLNEIWAYRLPSLLGATLAVLMTAALGGLLFGPETGLWAAMMLASCVLLNVEARLAKTDAALLGCIVTAMYALARAYRLPPDNVRRLSPLITLLFWTALAGGILIKGPIILLPVLGVLIWLKVAEKNIAWFRALHPVKGALYTLALCAPWLVALSLQSHGTALNAFLHQSAGQDMFAKIWQGQNRGWLPPGAHLMALPIMFFPFSLLIVLALPQAWKSRHEPGVGFLIGWIVPTWIIFELSLTKLPHYVLPTYPALALLAAKFLHDGFAAAARRRLPLALVIGLWLMVGTGFAVVFALAPDLLDQRWFAVQIGAGIVLVVLQTVALFRLPRAPSSSVALLSAASLIFMTATFGDTLPRLQPIWLSREITRHAALIAPCPRSKIISSGYHEPSLVFLAGTDTVLATDGAAAAAALQSDACQIAVIGQHEKAGFLKSFKGAARQPVDAGTVTGLNSGHGGPAVLTFYLLPRL